jgi:hypothetical protein
MVAPYLVVHGLIKNRGARGPISRPDFFRKLGASGGKTLKSKDYSTRRVPEPGPFRR